MNHWLVKSEPAAYAWTQSPFSLSAARRKNRRWGENLMANFEENKVRPLGPFQELDNWAVAGRAKQDKLCS